MTTTPPGTPYDGTAGDPNDSLGPDDQRLIDELVESGFDPEVIARLEGDDRPRVAKILGLLELLHDYPVDEGDETLVYATLARIDRHEEERAARLSFDAHQEEAEGFPRRRIRMPDFITVAAVLLIATAVLWPSISQVRNHSIKMACENNLRHMGFAFGQYADDHGGAMPMAVAGANMTWETLHNVVNLGPLRAGNYCEQHHLSCPGVHEDSGVSGSYSYQWQVPGASTRWGAGAGTTVVLGDRNPLIDAFRAGEFVPPTSVSVNHGGRGQNVLSTDGSTLWLERPLIGRADNIWLPAGQVVLRAGALPAEPGDVFLAH
jgi:hypothetical protein